MGLNLSPLGGRRIGARTLPGSTSDIYTMHAIRQLCFFRELKSCETSTDKPWLCRWLRAAAGQVEIFSL